jgi:hypothetical protein
MPLAAGDDLAPPANGGDMLLDLVHGAALISGPVVTPSFSPSPTFSLATAADSFLAKAS